MFVLLFEETQKTIIDLFCHTKIKVSDIINMINTKEKLTLEQFYKFLEEYEATNNVVICRPKYDYESDLDKFIVELREQGKEFDEISQVLLEKGIKMEKRFYSKRYRNKYLEENTIKEARMHDKERKARFQLEQIQKEMKYKEQKEQDIENEIYILRKKGASCQEISNYFNKRKIKISRETIRIKSRKAFEDRGEPIPYYESACSLQMKNLTNEIQKQVELGYSYNSIWKDLIQKGYDVTYYMVRKKCREIKQKMGKDTEIRKGRVERYIPNDELYGLRKQGFKCTEIRDMYKAQHKKISYSYIVKKCKELELLEQEKNKMKIIDLMEKVASKKKATQEQMKIFANEVSKMYAIDLKVDYDQFNCIDNKDEKEFEK